MDEKLFCYGLGNNIIRKNSYSMSLLLLSNEGQKTATDVYGELYIYFENIRDTLWRGSESGEKVGAHLTNFP